MGIAEQLLWNLAGLVLAAGVVGIAIGKYVLAGWLSGLPARVAAWRSRGYPLAGGRKRHRAIGPAWILRTPATAERGES